MSELKVDKITPRLGTTLTLGDTGDTINFGSGVLPNFENLTVTGDLTVDTNSLYVDSTNNRVGIGTASPSYNLDLSSSSDAIINLKAAGQANGLQLSQLTADGGSSISATNNNYLKFSTNATERMRITSSGNVGIGTSSPTSFAGFKTLELNNSSGNTIELVTGTGVIAQTISNNTNSLVYIGSRSNHDLVITTNDAEAMRIKSNGLVGIGQSVPTSRLHIGASTDTGEVATRFQNSTANGFIGVESSSGNRFLGSSANNMFVGTTGADGLELATNNNVRMVIDTSGNVGIGTTPSAWGSPFISGVTQFPKGSIACESNGVILFNNAYYDGTNYKYIASAGAGSYAQTSGLHIFNVASSGTAGNNITFSEAMRIDSSGVVNVGTTTPVASATALSADGISGFQNQGNYAININRQTNDGALINFQRGGDTRGFIGIGDNDLYIGKTDGGTDCYLRFGFSNSQIIPANSSGAINDNTLDLGAPTSRFNDLYMGGNIYLGGTGGANGLDDYEEGTWTPTISGTSSSPTYYNRAGTYTKVGNLVTATLFLQTNAVSFSNNNDPLKITGYPFTPTGNTGYGYLIGSLSSQTFYYDGSYNDYGTTGVCHPEYQAVDSTIRFIVTASGAIRGTVKNLGMTVSGSIIQCWFQHYAT